MTSQTKDEDKDKQQESLLNAPINQIRASSPTPPTIHSISISTVKDKSPPNLRRSISGSILSQLQRAYFKCATTIQKILFLMIAVLILFCLVYNFLMPSEKDIKEETIQNLFKLLISPTSNPSALCKCRNSTN